jgi:hypothetical protein
MASSTYKHIGSHLRPSGINSTLDMAISIKNDSGMYRTDADFSIIDTQSPACS